MKKPPEELAAKIRAVSDKFMGTGLAVSVEDVARLADVPKATLYYYFAGRDDLVNFFLNDHLDRIGAAIPGAAAGDGPVIDRLRSTLQAILGAIAEHPALCIELPVALTQSGDFAEVVHNTERVVLAPLRELLIEGRAKGELDIADLDIAVQATMGSLFFTAMLQITAHGDLDAAKVGGPLIGQIVDGLTG